jgi:hypothetical protein
MHSSGQWIQSDYPITNDTNKPQAMGSALTYARRYSLAAMGVLAAEEDDDGNAAQDHGKANGNGNRAINADEFRQLKDLIEKTGSDEDKLLAYLKADTLETLTFAQFKIAEAALGKKMTTRAN